MLNFLDKKLFNLIIIAFLSCLTFVWTFWIFHQRFDFLVFIVVILCRILASMSIFKDYSLSWSKVTAKTFLLKTIVFFVPLFFYIPIFYKHISIAFFLSEFAFFVLAINFVMYSYAWYFNQTFAKPNKTLVIYGAGSGGMQVFNELKHKDYKLLCFIDDDESLQKRSIDNVNIISKQYFKQRYSTLVDLLIIAIPSISPKQISSLHDELKQYFKEIKILPSIHEILRDDVFLNQLKNISIEDLLARNPKDLDKNAIENFIKDKYVLITGAGGSIGSELCRQVKKYKAKKIYALDCSEFALYKLGEELGEEVELILENVVNFDALKDVFKHRKIDLVIHAAAYKHVPLVEQNISSGLTNNILGTKNCIDLADEFGVSKFILISTDKAVRPTNVMGASKRVCELYAANKKTKNMQIIAVRFGNVLGSSGSVIPKFKSQIKNNQNLSVTHKDITRYFMLICEACELVLQSGALGKGGEVFILDMGEPVKILDLAKKMIELSGKKGIGIDFIGLRAGEKLYEELHIQDSDINTKYPSIFISQNSNFDIEILDGLIKEMFEGKDKIKILQQIVPEFTYHDNKENQQS